MGRLRGSGGLVLIVAATLLLVGSVAARALDVAGGERLTAVCLAGRPVLARSAPDTGGRSDPRAAASEACRLGDLAARGLPTPLVAARTDRGAGLWLFTDLAAGSVPRDALAGWLRSAGFSLRPEVANPSVTRWRRAGQEAWLVEPITRPGETGLMALAVW